MRSIRKVLGIGSLVGLTLCTASAAHADEKGEKILREAFQTMSKARSLTADITTERTTTGEPPIVAEGKVALEKPNLLRVSLTPTTGKRRPKRSYISDGKGYFSYTEGGKYYWQDPVDAIPHGFAGEWVEEIDSFFEGGKNSAGYRADYVGTESLNGVLCDLVRLTNSKDYLAYTYAIGRKDHLFYRGSWTTKVQRKIISVSTCRLSNIKINGTSDKSLFVFTPPENVKRYDQEVVMKEAEARLVPVGEEAPAFELMNPLDKNRFSLAKAMEGRKAVLVNFWFYG